MSENKERIIAVCAAGMDEAYIETFLNAFADCAKEYHFKALFFYSFSPLYEMETHDRGEKKIYELINYDMLDGLVVLSQTIKQFAPIEELIEHAKTRNIPVVSIDYPHFFEGCYNVRFHFETAMTAIISHLIEVHHARRINFIAGMKDNEYSDQRLDIYRKVLQEHGIPVEEERIGYGDFWFGPTNEVMDRFLSSDLPFPDAIVCANDIMAIIAHSRLVEAGYRVPEDVMIAGYDGIHEALFHSPPIATAKCDIPGTAKTTCQLFDDLFHGIPRDYTVLIDSILFLNGSCGCHTESSLQQNDLIRALYFKNDRRNDFDTKQMRMIAGLTEHNSFQELFDRLKLYAEDLPNEQFAVCITDNFLAEEEFSDIVEDNSLHQRSGYSSKMDEMLYRRHNKWTGITEFETKNLLPDLDRILEESSSLIFFPLHVQEQTIGYTAFSYDKNMPSISQYYLFCTNISLSLEIIKSHRRQQTIIQNLENKYVHDPLTGLYNRRGFFQKVTGIYANCTHLSQLIMIISVDLNGLKPINDTYGHADGDIAISTVGKALLHSASEDTVCARFGGDEFVVAGVISCEQDAADYIASAEKYIERFNQNSGKPYSISASFGYVTAVPNDAITLDEFISQADEKMYFEKAKHHLSRGR